MFENINNNQKRIVWNNAVLISGFVFKEICVPKQMNFKQNKKEIVIIFILPN